MDLSSILLGAQSPDHAVRTQAETMLKEAEQTNFGTYLATLADHLAGNQNNPESRRLAGLIIKNCIHARDPSVRSQYLERWVQGIDEPGKAHIRRSLINTLSAQAPEPRRAAAQVIAKIAAMDMSRPGGWDTLINELLSSCSNATDDHLKQACLETLGYICEEATFGDSMDTVLSEHSNQILTAVVQGMSYQGSSASTPQSVASVRFASTIALNNTLEFARSQFEVPAERSAIVNTLCEAARSGDENVRQAAFEGLVKVAENYYDKLHEYIRDIYTLTENAIRSDVEAVAMQAIEFWSTVAEEEVTILYEVESIRESGKNPERESKHFVLHALPYLCVPIFDSLKKQEDDPLEDGSWNTATAAGACIELLAAAAPDTILDLVKPFVEANIRDQANWRSREAAILAFGSVLDGPPADAVQGLVKDAIKVLINALMNDPNLAVKDTTAWALARVVIVDRETTLEHLQVLVECLRSTLSMAENPLFAAHVCYAIHNIADRFSEDSENDTGPLKPYLEQLVQALIQTADRGDAGESSLRIAAYESISAIFRNVSRDGIPFVHTVTPSLLEKLNNTINGFQHALNDDDVQNLLETQGLLCGALTTATHRLSKEQLLPMADAMMQAYLRTFESGGANGSMEDSFLAIGALADTIGNDFNRYMPHLMPILQQALSNLQHWQLCGVAVGVTGELCRSLGKDLVRYADKLVFLLLEGVKSSQLDRSVKPTILTCFGDIAMSVKGEFERFLKPVMDCMKQAAESSVNMTVSPDDFDTMDWLHMLRESVLEAYVGMVSGLRDGGKQELLIPYIDWVLSFCEVMVERDAQGASGANALMSEETMKPMMALLGDLGDAIPQFKDAVNGKVWVQRMLELGVRSTDPRTKELADWALNVIFNR